jgi:peptidoglycan hydrolase-like protein with peptidoglycan-binding domain
LRSSIIAQEMEAQMNNKNLILTALALSGSLAFGCQSTSPDRTANSGSGSEQSMSADRQQKKPARISQSDMRKVEQALKAKGYDPGTIDGQADAQTQQALRSFQTKNNLAATGAIDPMTAESLGVVIIFLPE